MFRKVTTIIASGILFLALPISAFAESGFTASHVSFSGSTVTFEVDNPSSATDNGKNGRVTSCNLNNSCLNSGTDWNDSGDCTTVTSSPLKLSCTLDSGTYRPSNGDKVHIAFNAYNGASFVDTMYSQAVTWPLSSDGSSQIIATPSSSTVSVGVPFKVQVAIPAGIAWNAAKAAVSVSSNLTITGLQNDGGNSASCNLQYTAQPTTSSPSFDGAIFGGYSLGTCNVYTLTLTPNATGTGTVTISSPDLKAYADNSDISTGYQSGSYTINAAPTPTPTWGVPQLTVTSPLQTYYIGNSYTLTGTKDTSITHVFVNGSETGVTFPDSTHWQVSESLAALGSGNTPSNNYFTIYGSDGTSNTASQTVNVSRHTLGDINGDGNVDLTDASLFAVDYGKTSNLTYILSDMDGPDGNANLTDLSILAKLEQ